MLSLLGQGKIEQIFTGNIYNYLAVLYEKQFLHQEARRYAKISIQAGIRNQKVQSHICEYKNILYILYLNTGQYEIASQMITGLLHDYHNPYYEESVYRLQLGITFLNVCFHQDRNKEYEKEPRWLYPRLRSIFGNSYPELSYVRKMNIYYLARSATLLNLSAAYECAGEYYVAIVRYGHPEEKQHCATKSCGYFQSIGYFFTKYTKIPNGL